jgi:hypothetical protein
VSERRKIQQAYRFELDPNQAQRVLLTKSVGASRFVYNWGLEQSNGTYVRLGKRPKLGELKKRLVELKKGECPWLYEVSAHIGQSALRDLNDALERYFKGLTGQGPKSRFPRFKKRGAHDSARLYEVELFERHIRLPNIGRIRLKETRSRRSFHGRILSATIRRRAGRWFVSLCVECEREIVEPKPVRKMTDIVGVDLAFPYRRVSGKSRLSRVLPSRGFLMPSAYGRPGDSSGAASSQCLRRLQHGPCARRGSRRLCASPTWFSSVTTSADGDGRAEGKRSGR